MPDQVDWRAIEREATPGRAVGRLLHDQREARGLSISDVEKRIRIRRNYVEAIEQGRFDLLPGAAYIPAFLRMYANHLGLDPEKVLTAYQLSGPVPIKRPVALPADFPLVEKRAPIGLAVLTILLAIGAGYAVWHYLPRHQTVVAEKVPPVPDRLLASRPGGGEPAAATGVVPSPTPAVTANDPPRGTPSGVQQAWPASRQETTRQETMTGSPPAPPIVVTVPAPPPAVIMSVPPAIGQAQAAQVVDPQEARRAGQPAPTPAGPTPPASTPDAAAPPAGGAAGIPTKVDTPVVVRANSWVELRAPNGDVLAMTYVRAGESYTVPAGIAYRVIDAR